MPSANQRRKSISFSEITWDHIQSIEEGGLSHYINMLVEQDIASNNGSIAEEIARNYDRKAQLMRNALDKKKRYQEIRKARVDDIVAGTNEHGNLAFYIEQYNRRYTGEFNSPGMPDGKAAAEQYLLNLSTTIKNECNLSPEEFREHCKEAREQIRQLKSDPSKWDELIKEQEANPDGKKD